MSPTEPSPSELSPAERKDGGHGPLVDGEISTRAILWSVVGLVIVVVISMLSMVWMMGSMQEARAAGNPPPSPLAEANEPWVPPGPQLQEYPPIVDIEELRAREDEVLESYRWIDEEAGVVRIPLSEALRIFEEGGLPEPVDVDSLSEEIFGVAASPPEDAAGGES